MVFSLDSVIRDSSCAGHNLTCEVMGRGNESAFTAFVELFLLEFEIKSFKTKDSGNASASHLDFSLENIVDQGVALLILGLSMEVAHQPQATVVTSCFFTAGPMDETELSGQLKKATGSICLA